MIEPELVQAGVECPSDHVRREVLVPDFCGHVKVIARDGGGRDRSTDRLLIVVHFGGVDMAIAERQRTLDRRATGVTPQAEGAEPEPRQADALGLQMVHERSSKHEMVGRKMPCGAEGPLTGETAGMTFGSLAARQSANQDRRKTRW